MNLQGITRRILALPQSPLIITILESEQTVRLVQKFVLLLENIVERSIILSILRDKVQEQAAHHETGTTGPSLERLEQIETELKDIRRESAAVLEALSDNTTHET